MDGRDEDLDRIDAALRRLVTREVGWTANVTAAETHFRAATHFLRKHRALVLAESRQEPEGQGD